MPGVEITFQLAVIALGYLLGAGAAWLVLKLAGAGLAATAAALVLLAVPLAVTLAAEAATGRWLHTPGTVGTGGLVVFLPMLIAGALLVATARVAQGLLPALDPRAEQAAGPLWPWVVALALAGSLAALGLWRFWPEPTPRLW